MHTLQNTLYVMTPQAYAHLENATLRIDVEREKKLQVPLHHIGARWRPPRRSCRG